MNLSFSDLSISDIKIFDKTFSIENNWEFGIDFLSRKGETMSFSIGENYFDVIFDIDGSCNWTIDKGDYMTGYHLPGETDFIEQKNIDINIFIKEVWSETINIDITDSSINNFLTNLIKSNIE